MPNDDQGVSTLASGARLYRQRHGNRRPIEDAEPAGTLASGAQQYRTRNKGVVIEAGSQPDNLGPEAA